MNYVILALSLLLFGMPTMYAKAKDEASAKPLTTPTTPTINATTATAGVANFPLLPTATMVTFNECITKAKEKAAPEIRGCVIGCGPNMQYACIQAYMQEACLKSTEACQEGCKENSSDCLKRCEPEHRRNECAKRCNDFFPIVPSPSAPLDSHGACVSLPPVYNKHKPTPEKPGTKPTTEPTTR